MRNTNKRVFVVSAANRAAANTILQRQGYGPDNFSIPLVRNDQKDIVKEANGTPDYYACHLPSLDDATIRVITNKLSHLTIREHDRTFEEALTEEQATKESDRHEFILAIIIPTNARTAVINALSSRYPDADTRFFTTRLSASGNTPSQAYGDRWKVDRSFNPELKQFCDTIPRAEVWIWAKNEDALQAVKTVYDKPIYQDPDRVNRTKAFVHILTEPITPVEAATFLGLKIIP